MVKVAKTEEEKKKCAEYLRIKGTLPATNIFFYKENAKGEIIGAYGVETKTCIEPLQAEDRITAFELLTHGIAVAQTMGCEKVHFITCNPQASKVLQDKYEAVLWSRDIEELFINLTD